MGSCSTKIPPTPSPRTRRNDEMSEKDKLSLQIKRDRERLMKYNDQMEIRIERQTELAKKLIQESKSDKARLVLRQKRFLQNMLDGSRQKLFEFEQLIESIQHEELMSEVNKSTQLAKNILSEMKATLDASTDTEIQHKVDDNLTEEDERKVDEEMEELEQTISK